MNMSMVESYAVGSPSVDSNKLLVVFPGIEPIECKDVDAHLSSVTKVSKGVMDIRRFLSPSHQNSQVKSKVHTIEDSSEAESEDINVGLRRTS
jgi:hypothetical protein